MRRALRADLASRKRKCCAAVAANWRDGKSGKTCREIGKPHSVVVVRLVRNRALGRTIQNSETAIEPKSRGVLDARWSLSSGAHSRGPGGGDDKRAFYRVRRRSQGFRWTIIGTGYASPPPSDGTIRLFGIQIIGHTPTIFCSHVLLERGLTYFRRTKHQEMSAEIAALQQR